MVAFRFVRSVVVNQILKIWHDDMPNVDRIYALLQDIYLVRAMRLYSLEEDLFAKLIFIMRSREMAIKVTRHFDNTYNPEFIYVKHSTFHKHPSITSSTSSSINRRYLNR